MRIFVAVAALVLPLAVVVPVAEASPAPQAVGTRPVDSYARAVHQSVRVHTSTDTDGDGKPDEIAVDLIRPREPAAAGLKVPVIMDASPYFTCCGRGNEGQVKTYDSHGVIKSLPLFYDNYFVPRGYAVMGVDILGTGRSSGCGDYGGPGEIGSVTAVIDWLNGRAIATNLAGKRVRATWANGTVGMIGKSYDGTLAEGVAATGVDGLATIVPISAIDSWYDYSRSYGVVYGWHYVRYLLDAVGRTDGVCDRARASYDARADDATGAYNAFWKARDYLARVDQVRASVFASHGVNDTNVQTKHVASWWAALGTAGVPRKLWLSQEGHVDPFDYRRSAWVVELHRWFDHWLMGIDNGVMDEAPVTVEHDPNSFRAQQRWPARTSTTYALGTGGLGDDSGGTLSVTDQPSLTEAQVVANPDTNLAGRLMFRTPALTSDLRISGTPTLTLRVKADRTDTPITAKLVDYGSSVRPKDEGVRTATTRSCWGRSTPQDSACYLDVLHDFSTRSVSVISRGWVDAAYAADPATSDPLQPGTWRVLTVPLLAQDDVLASGHRLGLALTLSDEELTTPRGTGATLTIDLAHSTLVAPGH